MKISTSLKAELAQRIFASPDLADLAIGQLWNCLSNDIQELVCMADCHVAKISFNQVEYHALIFSFVDANLLSKPANLDMLVEILKIVHSLMGLTSIVSMHGEHGVLAELNAEDRCLLWSF